MMQTVPAGDVGVMAVRAALGPFAWRSFTAAALCRRAVAAMDATGVLSPELDPDYSMRLCAEALVEVLDGCRWQSFTLDGLSRLLVGAARAWRQEQAWFDIRLGLLLDGVG